MASAVAFDIRVHLESDDCARDATDVPSAGAQLCCHQTADAAAGNAASARTLTPSARLIWKDLCQAAALFVIVPFVCCAGAAVSVRPTHRAIRTHAAFESRHLIDRAITTMNHSDIRGLGTA